MKASFILNKSNYDVMSNASETSLEIDRFEIFGDFPLRRNDDCKMPVNIETLRRLTLGHAFLTPFRAGVRNVSHQTSLCDGKKRFFNR